MEDHERARLGAVDRGSAWNSGVEHGPGGREAAGPWETGAGTCCTPNRACHAFGVTNRMPTGAPRPRREQSRTDSSCPARCSSTDALSRSKCSPRAAGSAGSTDVVRGGGSRAMNCLRAAARVRRGDGAERSASAIIPSAAPAPRARRARAPRSNGRALRARGRRRPGRSPSPFAGAGGMRGHAPPGPCSCASKRRSRPCYDIVHVGAPLQHMHRLCHPHQIGPMASAHPPVSSCS